jgi:phosphatidate cytidylyltransferase
MSQLTQRLLLFFLGIPLLIGIIVFLPMYNHLVWNIIMILASIAGASELFKMLNKKFDLTLRKLPLAGAYLPVAAYLEVTGLVTSGFIGMVLIIIISIIMTREVLLKDKLDIDKVISRFMASTMILIYPGLFMAYTIKVSMFSEATYLILLFLILIFTNDSMAFVTGSIFGRKSTNLFLVSPNKSVVGFIGGIFFTIITGLFFRLIFPIPISFWQMMLLAAASTISANTGDLIESAIKRSADVKDAGNLMPGRGGLLDSIDSILFSAPIYYYILLKILN